MNQWVILCVSVVIFIVFLVQIVPSVRSVHKKVSVEAFEMKQHTLEAYIIEIYQEVLQRQPTGKELAAVKTAFVNYETTLEGLRKKLIDSDEYERLMKTQSNVLAPELTKMISDQSLLELIASIYNKYRSSNVPNGMLLPLRDVYIYLDYNKYKLIVVLQHKNYKPFEKDILSEENLDKDLLIQTFLRYFDMKEINKEAALLQKAADETGQRGYDGLSYAPVNHRDTDSTNLLNNIMNGLRKQQECKATDDKVYTSHANDMVLNPAYEWSVPQERPPVCTTLGQPALTVQPLLENSRLLLGTPLTDAKNTGVGSIMPKFEFNQYVDVKANKK